jgi:hypothetical protein
VVRGAARSNTRLQLVVHRLGYGVHSLRFDSQHGKHISVFFNTSQPALKPNHSSLQGIRGFFSGGKAAGA